MNSVNLIGNLAEPPRLESGAGGEDRCALRLAVRRRGRGGRAKPGVVYVDVVALGADARECAKRLAEGLRVGVSGLVEVDEWRDEDGTWHTRQDIVADAVEFLDPPAPDPEAEPEPGDPPRPEPGEARPRRRRRRREADGA